MTHTIAFIELPARKAASHVVGDHKEVFATVTVSAYTASGEVMTAAEFGLKSIAMIQAEFAAAAHVRWDGTGSKFVCYVITTGIEAAGNVNVGAFDVRVIGY
jgi:hypothetical protein